MTGKAFAGSPARVLVVHRYYWPDTPPYAAMLRRIVQQWVSDGHDITVLSSQPSYKANVELPRRPSLEELDGAAVKRLTLPPEAGRPAMRLLNALRLCFSVFIRVLFGRFDLVMISTSPPVVGGFMASLAARLSGTRFVYHCMDIHPEIGRISGEFRFPLVYRALEALDGFSCRQAKPVVVLSDDMRDALRQRKGGANYQIEVINNFSLPADGDVGSAELPFHFSANRFYLLFAGNVGRFQGLETLVEAMALLCDREDIVLVILGDGVAKPELERMARRSGARVSFPGHHPVHVAKAMMARADLGFISLVPGICKYAFPSKTMTYLEQGCPLLVAVEQDSALAAYVRDNHVGLVVPQSDPQALADVLRQCADGAIDTGEMKARATLAANRDFSENALLPRWSSLLSDSGRAGS